MRTWLVPVAMSASQALAVEPIQVSKSAYFVRGETGLPSIANRRNAWNTYVRMQGEPFDTGGNHGNR
jgi:hypothetical protein